MAVGLVYSRDVIFGGDVFLHDKLFDIGVNVQF